MYSRHETLVEIPASAVAPFRPKATHSATLSIGGPVPFWGGGATRGQISTVETRCSPIANSKAIHEGHVEFQRPHF
jgi:hypothetical protein